MYRITTILLAFFFISSMEASEKFIVLSSEKSSETLAQQKVKYYNLLNTNSVIHDAFSALKFQDKVANIGNTTILKVGPFPSNDLFALVYLTLKESFPKAFIVEERALVVVPKPIVNTVEKKIYINKEIVVEKEDDTLWVALFGLAIVGVLFMFLSSDKIKRLKEEHEKIKKKHKSLEQKQHEVLASMGENIHILAKETMSHTSKLAEKVKATHLEEDIDKVIYSENELLDVTGDLIKFLRLKSKKVIIQNEVFNFNNVLNEVAGLLHNTYKQNDTELIFDIDKSVPGFMLTDSLHLGQVLLNLLEYFMLNSQTKEIKLVVTTYSSLKVGLQLQFQVDGDIVIKDKTTLFDSYYDEKSRKYMGLGLFVAKELVTLMNGTIHVKDVENGCHSLVFALPIEDMSEGVRKYRLPDKSLVGKKILIVDKSNNAALATEKLFAYFRAEIKVLTSEEFVENMPNFALYDIVALENSLFNIKSIEALKEVKNTQGLKVVSLDNLFSSKDIRSIDIVDVGLKKPLNQEYVFDTLIELYEEKTVDIVDEKEENREDSLFVHREAFKDVPNVTLESFQKFKDIHLLIVEDNIINQKVVQSILDKSGMKLSVANNGEEAVQFMRNTSEEVDFIFMDINMPVMDGYRATELIRKESRFDKVVIVSLTALVSEHEIEKMFDSGMNGYLPKPVRVERLYSALNSFLGDSITPDTIIEIEEKIFPSYEGLNVEEGLKHTKGNVVFYKEILKEFVDAYKESDVLFAKLIKEQRFEQVKMLCLDMKGLTGTIGAKEMHTLINEVQQHLLYNKRELLPNYIPMYRTEFLKLVKSIDTFLSA